MPQQSDRSPVNKIQENSRGGVKPFLNDNAKDVSEINLRNIDDEIITDRLEITEIFAEYFSNMAANIGGHHVKWTEEQCSNHPRVKNMRRKFNDINFNFAKLDEREVQAELKSLNTRKSCGWNPMSPPKLLHMSAEGITPSLTYFYNECIEKGQWPHDRKKGEWIPVFTKNDPQKEENYRPITTLLTVGKIFEKLLSTQIVSMTQIFTIECLGIGKGIAVKRP